MTDLREKIARAIDDQVRQALSDFDIGDEAIRNDCELWPSALLTADAALAVIEAEGWQLVPKEATEEMLEDGAIWISMSDKWTAMLATAPRVTP